MTALVAFFSADLNYRNAAVPTATKIKKTDPLYEYILWLSAQP